jgi:hypothetical protein
MVCKRHIEALGQVFDHHAALGAGKFQDLGLPEVQRHGSISSSFPAFRAFCHGSRRLSANFSLSQVCGILRLQQKSPVVAKSNFASMFVLCKFAQKRKILD